jgi:diaminohydroxyphosphoribosylaminopyrimidine deaminase/5-amino-6-(5-phosphoribosylamino)uracil reductase
VGSQTVLADDPALTARFSYEQGRQPWRVVLDGRLRTPAESRLLTTAGGPVVIFTTPASAPRRGRLELAGARVIPVATVEGSLSVRAALERLGRMGVVSVLVEGGPTVLAALQAERLGNRLVVFMAPTVLGGQRAPGPFGKAGASLLSEGWAWKFAEVSRVGPDLRIEARAA